MMDDENFARDTAQSFFSQSQASGATGATSLATEQTVSSLAIEKFKAQQQEPQHHHVHRICRICGRVVAAKGLPRFDTYSMSDPYCVVKAIKGNNHTMNVYITRTIMNNSAPVWDEEFDFQIRADQTTEEIVGLRLAVYEADGPGSSFHGSNDFLGGADLDLAGQKHARSVLHELELGGIITRKASSGRRPRLVLAVTIYREVVPRSLPRPLLLKQSLLKMSFVHQAAVPAWTATVATVALGDLPQA
ncbi:Cytosolic phospholipase A2 delta (cPLA2-delta) (Phospholipase A2 group IVD) [Durusdinium trenchii]|uniref:Cytosolic phospholipase A2 delta (CPLA2-delta) (Phospholipase A2 group IVD) n=1 Tax=Durusdinium trenchii TaxID=1381693 RepID=A0ABP0SPY7_9DINO